MPPRQKTLEAQIDENLRRVFEEDAAADLPEHLLELLAKLEEIDAPPEGLPETAKEGSGANRE